MESESRSLDVEGAPLEFHVTALVVRGMRLTVAASDFARLRDARCTTYATVCANFSGDEL